MPRGRFNPGAGRADALLYSRQISGQTVVVETLSSALLGERSIFHIAIKYYQAQSSGNSLIGKGALLSRL